MLVPCIFHPARGFLSLSLSLSLFFLRSLIERRIECTVGNSRGVFTRRCRGHSCPAARSVKAWRKRGIVVASFIAAPGFVPANDNVFLDDLYRGGLQWPRRECKGRESLDWTVASVAVEDDGGYRGESWIFHSRSVDSYLAENRTLTFEK